jgi:hypothetical protein
MGESKWSFGRRWCLSYSRCRSASVKGNGDGNGNGKLVSEEGAQAAVAVKAVGG